MLIARIALVIAVSSVLSTGVAFADDPPVYCPPDADDCFVVVDDPGTPGSTPTPTPQPTGGSGGNKECKVPSTGEVVPCNDPTFGWFDNGSGCYYRRVDPQPPKDDPVWEGHTTGAIYQTTCLGGPGGTGGGWTWVSDPPVTPPPDPTPGELGAKAAKALKLDGPAIVTAPGKGRTGLVGLPVWLWTKVSPSTWGPTTAMASVPGLSVTATAKATKVTWDMGDGSTVTCTRPGTPYAKSKGDRMSPDCGHRYTTTSRGEPGGAFTITATTTWDVTWAGGGQSGRLTQQRTSTTTIRIGELQVLIR